MGGGNQEKLLHHCVRRGFNQNKNNKAGVTCSGAVGTKKKSKQMYKIVKIGFEDVFPCQLTSGNLTQLRKIINPFTDYLPI